MNRAGVFVLARVGAIVMTAALMVIVGGPAFAPSAGATSAVGIQRLAGTDRFGTAASVAAAGFPGGSTVVVLADGLNFPDALAASYLAGRLHSPILLTNPTSLPSATLGEISSLGAKGVDVVGGTSAVSPQIVASLQVDHLQVDRIAGVNRFATAAAVAQIFPANSVGSVPGDGRTAIVASGVNFPDALSGGPMAYASAFPILLANPTSLPSQTSSALSALGISEVLLLGGTAALSASVANQIAALNISVTRVAGQDRTATATAVAGLEASSLGFSSPDVLLARGDDFSDALAGTSLAGQLKMPILLTESPDALGPYSAGYLSTNAPDISGIDVLGGTSAIATTTLAAADVDATSPTS